MRMFRCLIATLAVALTTGAQTTPDREHWNRIFADQKVEFNHAANRLLTVPWFHLSKLDSAQRLRDAPKPGGLLVIEGFAGDRTGYQTNERLRAFSSLNVFRYEDLMDQADWSPGQRSHIIRFVAEKPR